MQEVNICEILDQGENRGIQKGIELMQGESDTLRAEKEAVGAERDAAIAEKNSAIAEPSQKEADLDRAMQLLKIIILFPPCCPEPLSQIPKIFRRHSGRFFFLRS